MLVEKENVSDSIGLDELVSERAKSVVGSGVEHSQYNEVKVGNSTKTWLSFGETEHDHESVYSSWCNSGFSYQEENTALDLKGLRPPQLGGVFAALGYERSDYTTSATIVMPTGTGKTETILSMVVAGRFRRTLVIVPSDALREQTKKKFVELGLLRKLGLISEEVKNPVTSTIKHGVSEFDDLEVVLNSNVIIASATALSKFSKEYFDNLTASCTHLVVDEAHHITAATWARVKAQFRQKPVFQFTATPFRSDGSRIEGKIVFNYPLKKAQSDGYFKPIEFHPVREFVDELSDQAIAQKAIELLRKDLDAGYEHILMARVGSIKRAEKIFEIYEKETDLNPILINSKTKKKSETLVAIRNREHKIIVCVDMLGEGFDLPQLKISAIHDPHKSINIMLQFTGRFTRNTQNVGDAKFVANIALSNVNESLEELYKENSDWNSIISNISARKISNEREYQDFREEFSNPSKLLDLGLTPSISTTVYRMTLATWKPEIFQFYGNKNIHIVDSILNDEENTLVFSVKSYLPVGWTSSKELFDESWDLYIAYYDAETDLLFVHSSAKDGQVKRLVNIIADKATQISGERVFRSLAGVKRLKLQNVGLNKNKKGLRYSMHTGTGINEQIPDIEANRAIKSNIFGKGYENGKLVSVGCSHKGKVWSMDSDSLEKWIDWCKEIGKKLLDDTIDTNEILKTAMQTEEIDEYPDIAPLSVEWPAELLRKNESKILIRSPLWERNLLNCDLVVGSVHQEDNKNLAITLKTDKESIQIRCSIVSRGEVRFSCEVNLDVVIGEKSFSLMEFFEEYPPILFLSDTSIIDGGYRYFSKQDYAYLYDVNNTEAWDWSGVDISIESQTPQKLKNSIQYFTIHKILDNYDLVFDDDGAGEIADIVAIKNNGDSELVVDLFHCKYCSKKNGVAKPGARVDDVYQVAGQAGKSIKRFSDIEKLVLRLMERERTRLRQMKPSRIDKGTFDDLVRFAKIARYADFKLGVAVVQPAISKALISKDQLAILGATAAYIDEVSGVKLRVIVNS